MWVLLAWACAAFVVEAIAALGWWVSVLCGVFFLSCLICYWLYARSRPLPVEIKEQMPQPMPGLILPLSTLCIFQSTPGDDEALEALIEAGDNVSSPLKPEEDRLLERSNLKAALAALEYHYAGGMAEGASRRRGLRDCWLIGTEDLASADGTRVERGSWRVAPVLVRWFFTRHREARDTVQFHYGDYDGLSLLVGPRDYTGMWRLIERLYERAKYRPDQLIVDITPGTKPMTLAIGLACLAPKRIMQYMATGRHPLTGEVLPQGQPAPVLIDIDPHLPYLYPIYEE